MDTARTIVEALCNAISSFMNTGDKSGLQAAMASARTRAAKLDDQMFVDPPEGEILDEGAEVDEEED